MDTKVANIQIAPKIDWHKIVTDLGSIKALKEFAKNNNWRPVVSGGYSLDLFLNMTTRTHNDVDMVIYAQESRDEAIKKLNAFIQNVFKNAELILKHDTFFMEVDVNAPGYGANLYFVETADNPFTDQIKVKKIDGEIITNTDTQLPKPGRGKIGDLEIEIQDQNAHLADILAKHANDTSPSKYDQDIANLRHITDPKRVEALLKNR